MTFLDLIDFCPPDSCCWEWHGAFSQAGYGTYGRWDYAHRLSYSHFIGRIPKGTHLDHLCRNRSCVNPGHLEIVSPAENLKRGCGKGSRQRNHCLSGHRYTDENTRWYKGTRKCRACHRISVKNRKRAKNAK